MPAPPALDGCPGILALHPARDGHVARIRLPGGYVSGPQWQALARLAGEFGDTRLDLTARGNVQLRGLREAAAADLAQRAARAGLLPSGPHDRARNITASPLSGLSGRPALRRLVGELDAALIADPALAVLPGRFCCALDDGTGRGGLAGCDIGLRQAGPELDLIVAGRMTGVRVLAQAAIAAVVRAAGAAVARGVGRHVTRIRDLAGAGEPVAAAIGGSLGPQVPPDGGRLALGIPPGGERAVIVAAPLGRLTVTQLTLIGSLLSAGEIVRLASAGRLVIPVRGPAARLTSALASLAEAGLVTADDHELAGVSACSGAACRRSLADVRAIARPLPGWPRIHWAGCARRCGCPPDAEPVTAAGPDMFEVPGLPHPQPLTSLAAAR